MRVSVCLKDDTSANTYVLCIFSVAAIMST